MSHPEILQFSKNSGFLFVSRRIKLFISILALSKKA
jgi:hypothetical protein